tara:strand:+ start:155 stop:313 length:159 start_codon:yes stop_codon:yes gene_type:complete
MLVVVGEEDLLLVVGIMGHELVELLVLVVVMVDGQQIILEDLQDLDHQMVSI